MMKRCLGALFWLCFTGAAWGQGIPGIGPLVPNGGGSVAASGTFTAGDLIVGGPGPTQVQDASALATAATVPKGLQFSNNIVYAGASDATNSWLQINGKTLSGTATAGLSGNISPFQIYVGSDTADASAAPGFLTVFNVLEAPSAGFKGGRLASRGIISVVGSPGAALGGAGLVGVTGQAQATASLLGTSNCSGASSYASCAGTLFGGNFQVIGKSGATNITLLIGAEFDAACEAGCSTGELHAATFVLTNDSTSRGVYDDGAIQIGSQGGSTTWKYGIEYGSYAGAWPFGTDSTLIYAWSRQAGGSSSPVALNGIDFSNITFQSAGCVLKSTNFCIDGPTGDLLLAAAGTVSNPTIALTTCGTNCGIFAPASGEIEFTIAGANVLDYGVTVASQFRFAQGITIGSGSINLVGSLGAIQFRNATTAITSPATSSVQIGFADTTTATAQILRTQSVAAGSSNVAGANWTIVGSLSTGSGASGDIIFQTGGTGAGAAVQNTATTALTIKGATQQLVYPAVTGTPAASLCLDASNNIIKKTTTGACI